MANRIEEPLPEAMQPLAQLYAPDEATRTSADVLAAGSSPLSLPLLSASDR